MSGARAGCPGPGTVDEFGGSRRENRDCVDGKGGDEGGNLDPLVAKQIHGLNPTKFHHTNKSQKKIGAIFVGKFQIRTETTKSS